MTFQWPNVIRCFLQRPSPRDCTWLRDFSQGILWLGHSHCNLSAPSTMHLTLISLASARRGHVYRQHGTLYLVCYTSCSYSVKDVNGTSLLYAVEHSHPCTRCCCGNARKMRLDVIPAAAVHDPSGDMRFNTAELMYACATSFAYCGVTHTWAE